MVAWCHNHYEVTEDDEKKLICLAHEGRALDCPYTSLQDSQDQRFPRLDAANAANVEASNEKGTPCPPLRPGCPVPK